MKTFIRRAVMALTVALVCQTGLALAEDIRWVSGDSKTASPATAEKAATPAPSACCVEDSKCPEGCLRDTGCEDCLCTAIQPCRIWYIDYRLQQMFSSHTSYQFGTPPGYYRGNYAPLSKLDWSLDSTWTGLRVGVLRPKLDVHFEWLAPMVQGIQGGLYDYDWNINDNLPNDPTRLDSLSHSSTRWTDGQKLELEADYKWTDCFLGLPIEFWPLAGFRFQRFNMTGYAGNQIIPPLGPFPDQGDMITFNQQYYIGYIGGQLRKTLQRREGKLPINMTLQADWGATSGYNDDHHLWYEQFGSHRYTMESTTGGTLHFALVAEVPVNCHLTVGLQADHSETRTTGTHHYVQYGGTTFPARDQTWDNGVKVNSDQTSLTAYARFLW